MEWRMKPWMVVNCDKTLSNFPVFRRRDNQTGVMYGNRQQLSLTDMNDGLQKDRAVVFFDDEGTADQYIDWYSKEYPGTALIKAKSVTATYREFGPVKTGVFTDKGMVPA
jgi:hypothetical protein